MTKFLLFTISTLAISTSSIAQTNGPVRGKLQVSNVASNLVKIKIEGMAARKLFHILKNSKDVERVEDEERNIIWYSGKSISCAQYPDASKGGGFISAKVLTYDCISYVDTKSGDIFYENLILPLPRMGGRN